MVPPSSGARTVPRLLVSRPVRYAVAATLLLALGLAGCGRKSALDPPPGGLADPSVTGAASPAAAPGPDGQIAAAGPNGQPGVQPATKKRLPIDWLLD
jgi:predicted small lipoprotein YifL